MAGLEYRELFIDEISDDMLNKFERYEEINRAWRIVNGSRILQDIVYIENWDNLELRSICNGLRQTLLNQGSVFATFDDELVVGFASLENKLFGSKKQYLQLSMIHVSKSYRSKGIGKLLFIKCVEKAKEYGAKKIYISASSCENTQLFYEYMGNVPAVEINMELTKLEPYDI